MATKLKNLKINEGSLVDKGANQEAEVVLFKRDKEEGGELGLLDKVKERIKKFFPDEAVGVSDVLDEKEIHQELFEIDDALRISVNSILEDDTLDNKRAAIAETLSQYLQELVDSGIVKIGRKVSGGRMSVLKEVMSAMGKAIESLGVMLEEVEGIEKGSDSMPISEEVLKTLPEDVQVEIAALQKDADEMQHLVTKNEELTKKVTELEKPDETEDEILKGASPEVIEKFEAMQKQVDAANEIAKAEQEARITKEYEDKAGELSLVGSKEEVARMLRSADEVSEEHGKSVYETLKANHKRIEQSDLLKETGSGGTDDSAGAYAKIEAGGMEIAKSENISKEQGIAKFMKTEEGAKLYEEHTNSEVN
jgi:hypothetical protein